MGKAIKTELVRQGVEVVLTPLSADEPISNLSLYHYLIVVVSGHEPTQDIKNYLDQIRSQLTATTKLSLVVSVAQWGLRRTHQMFDTKTNGFEADSFKRLLAVDASAGDGAKVKTQIALIQDVFDVSTHEVVVNPLQALLSDLNQGRITLAGFSEQVYYPLSSAQAAEVVVRELFVLRQKQQLIGVRGKQATPLIKLAFALKQALLEKGMDGVEFVSIDPNHHENRLFADVAYSHPAKAFSVADMIQSGALRPPQAGYVHVPQVKELPINLIPTLTQQQAPVVVPTPQSPVSPEILTSKKVVVKPRQITSTHHRVKPALINKHSPNTKKSNRPTFLVGLGLLLLVIAVIVIVALPFLQYVSSARALVKPEAENNEHSLQLTKLTRAQERITRYFSLATRLAPDRVDKHVFALNERVKQSTYVVVSQAHLSSLHQKLGELVSVHLNLVDGDIYQRGAELAQLAQQSYQDLTTLELNRRQAQPTALLAQEVVFDENTLKSLKASLKKLQLGLQSLPFLFPANESTNVLVLIQNSHELRATGGFIESVGLLRFDSGKLVSSQFTSSYELDELLDGKVDPPEDLPRFLGENQWYGRDVNWDPDFVTTAKNAAWFYEKQTNNHVDVVAALTLPAISALLDEIEGVSLDDGTLLHGTNLSTWITESQKKLTHTQSTQPLLAPVVALMLEKIQTLDQDNLSGVARTLGTSLEMSQIMVSASKPEISASLASLGWSGSVLSPVCPAVLSQAQCVVDTLYVNESNVGINSANAQVSRTQTHTISFAADKILHTHQINYVHSGQTTSWPGGVYQNYVRFYLPLDASLTKTTQDGVVIDDAHIYQTKSQNKNLIGFLVRIQPGSSSQVVVEYNEINPVSIQQALTYAFLLQKQPGITQAPLSLSLNYPPSYSLKRVSHPYALSDNHLLVNDSLVKHFFLAVELAP